MNWSSTGNDELREIIQEIMTITPGIGQTRMLGALHSRRIRSAAMESPRDDARAGSSWNSTSVERDHT